MTEQTTEVAVRKQSTAVAPGGAFASIENFENAQRMATAFAKSNLVPDTFKNNVGDCVIALEMSQRMGANPLAVMQNIYIVHGKPGWSAQFLVACINGCGRFSPLRYTMEGTKGADDRSCIAWAIDESGERLESPMIDIAMAKSEGWYNRNGSKWKTMPDLMLRYRAATFFARLYAPELTMGMQTTDEIKDIGADVTISDPIKGNLTPSITSGAPVEKVEPEVIPPKEPEAPKKERKPEPKPEEEFDERLSDDLLYTEEDAAGEIEEPEPKKQSAKPEGGPFAAPKKKG